VSVIYIWVIHDIPRAAWSAMSGRCTCRKCQPPGGGTDSQRGGRPDGEMWKIGMLQPMRTEKEGGRKRKNLACIVSQFRLSDSTVAVGLHFLALDHMWPADQNGNTPTGRSRFPSDNLRMAGRGQWRRFRRLAVFFSFQRLTLFHQVRNRQKRKNPPTDGPSCCICSASGLPQAPENLKKGKIWGKEPARCVTGSSATAPSTCDPFSSISLLTDPIVEISPQHPPDSSTSLHPIRRNHRSNKTGGRCGQRGGSMTAVR